MGMAEGKRKQRLVGSARTRNAAWSDDQTLPGQRLLASMGWQAGQAIGASSPSNGGRTAPVAVALKLDNKGIGAQRVEREARASGRADAWIGGNGDLGSLFERLNAASAEQASAEKVLAAVEDAEEAEEDAKSVRRKEKKARKEAKRDKKGKRKHEEEEEEEEAVIAVAAPAIKPAQPLAVMVNPRMAARAKYLRAKRMVGNDLSSINEILGIASPQSGAASPVVRAASPSPTPGSEEMPEKSKSSSRNRDGDKGAEKEARKAEKEARRVEKERKKQEKKEGRRRLEQMDESAADITAKMNDKKRRKEEKKAERDVEEDVAAAPPTFVTPAALRLPPSSDPSFDSSSGGGNRVSDLSVQQYLSNKLIVRRAEVMRKRNAQQSAQQRMWSAVPIST